LSKEINAILRTTPYLSATKQEITDFFNSNANESVRTDYIKNIFNNNVTDFTLGDDNRDVGYKAYQNVLLLYEGTNDNQTAHGFYDWTVVTRYYAGMVLLNELEADNSLELPLPDGVLDAILKDGSGFQEGKYRIHEFFQQNETAKVNTAFLNNEYGTGGRNPGIAGTNIGISRR